MGDLSYQLVIASHFSPSTVFLLKLSGFPYKFLQYLSKLPIPMLDMGGDSRVLEKIYKGSLNTEMIGLSDHFRMVNT